jgi:hypothetical protein
MQVYGFTFFVCALFAIVMSLQVNMDGDIKGLDKLQKANEFATHDAAIPLNLVNVSQGVFQFDKDIGRQNFIDSINYSLNTTWDGTEFIPNENSFFEEPIKLLYLEFVDSSNPSCSTFPCTFNVPIINKVENLAGPSVLAILETKSPQFFSGEPLTIRKLSIYEYK